MAPGRLATLLVFAALVAASGAAAEAQAAVTTRGYVTTRDGTELRYTLTRPAEAGRFPTLLQYQGYAAGTNPSDNGLRDLGARMLDRGFALLGVSVRGTGCSRGAADLFRPEWATDGYDVIEWAAKQSWSDGRIGMWGASFPSVTAFHVAGLRPPHLSAIAVGATVTDFYRDLGYPGGVRNVAFAGFWTAVQKQPGTQNLPAATAEDPQCASNYAEHEAANLAHQFTLDAMASPFIDDPFGWSERGPLGTVDRIDVPVLLTVSWQDEQLGSRTLDSLGRLSKGGRFWLVGTNGQHPFYVDSPRFADRFDAFVSRFVKGERNGFEQRWAKVDLWFDTIFKREGVPHEPAWRVEEAHWPPRVREHHLFLREGGVLGTRVAPGAAASSAFSYPQPSPGTLESTAEGDSRPRTGELDWARQVPSGGSATWTTPPLGEDVVVAGTASADLWVRADVPDADLQVTISEVRPDGQETYVQRGFLKLSHRRLDDGRSSPLLPVHTHRRADAELMREGEPVSARIEVLPFAHAFRRGSSIRLIVDAPAGFTGLWGFAPEPNPGRIEVLQDGEHPSRLVLGRLPGQAAAAPLPGCGTLVNQPCRANATPPPAPEEQGHSSTPADKPKESRRARLCSRAIRLPRRLVRAGARRVHVRFRGQSRRVVRVSRGRVRVHPPRSRRRVRVHLVVHTRQGRVSMARSVRGCK